MKVCIVTFHSAYNFGAVLQAYALCQYLNDKCDETRILDYHNRKIDDTYKLPRLSDYISVPKRSISKLMQYVMYKGKRKKIDNFRERLPLTKRYDEGHTETADAEADVFIAGSDQIWNYELIGRDSSYFLDFAKDKITCSYAASFGVNKIPEEYRDFYEEGMNNLDSISVRESNAVELVNSLCCKECSLMPDPTLLLDAEKWSEVSKEPNIKNPYILIYKITKEENLISFAKKLSRETGLPIVYIPNDIKSGIVRTTKFNVGPDEWLGYIKNAEYVVTNSFHGTAFSIIFGKKFFTEVSATANTATSRSYSLLRLFGLEDRIISNYRTEMQKNELPSEHIAEVIVQQRENVKKYFDKVFGGEA